MAETRMAPTSSILDKHPSYAAIGQSTSGDLVRERAHEVGKVSSEDCHFPPVASDNVKASREPVRQRPHIGQQRQRRFHRFRGHLFETSVMARRGSKSLSRPVWRQKTSRRSC